MITTKRHLAGALALTTALMVSSCAEYNIRELEKAPLEGGAFADQLAMKYKDLAIEQSRVLNDDLEASHFAVKGIQSATGDYPIPEDPRKYDVGDRLNDLMAWRERLIFALEKSGRIIAPDVAANAQVNFDCMVDEISDANRDLVARCETNFTSSLIQLEKMVAEKSPTFMVHFDYNSAALTADASKLLTEVAKTIANVGYHTVAITGHTDAIGGRKNNLTLSQKRAASVRDALVRMGVDDRKIVAVGGGELDGPEVAPKNRRVDIHIH